MSDLPKPGDLYVVVGEVPSGGVWGHPFTLNPDTWLVPVREVCIIHWLPPIDERGFCAGGEEYQLDDDSWEYDCDVREVRR